MRYSILFPLLLVLGMGCVVHDPAYSTGGYVAYYGPSYPVYYGDGYYWSYYNDGWYWWSRDRWVYTYSRPRSPVLLQSGPRGYHAPGYHAGGVRTRDHRTTRGGYHAPSARTAPPPRSAPPPSRAVAPRTTVRDHRR